MENMSLEEYFVKEVIFELNKTYIEGSTVSVEDYRYIFNDSWQHGAILGRVLASKSFVPGELNENANLRAPDMQKVPRIKNKLRVFKAINGPDFMEKLGKLARTRMQAYKAACGKQPECYEDITNDLWQQISGDYKDTFTLDETLIVAKDAFLEGMAWGIEYPDFIEQMNIELNVKGNNNVYKFLENKLVEDFYRYLQLYQLDLAVKIADEEAGIHDDRKTQKGRPLNVKFAGWYTDGNKVITCKKGSSVIARINISGGLKGLHVLQIRSDMSLAEDEMIEQIMFDYDGIKTNMELAFIPKFATGESGTKGYYVELLKGTESMWLMKSDYPPRLKVTI